MFQEKKKRKRLEKDVAQLYTELDDDKFKIKFPDPLKRNEFEISLLPSEDTKNEKPLVFRVMCCSDYPNKPPVVKAKNEADFPSGTHINKIRILEEDVWSFTYNLACVAHSIRRRFARRTASRVVRRLFRDTEACVLLGRGGFCERKGRRRTMEDSSVCMDRLPVPFRGKTSCFYAVFDGHGGDEAAKFAGRMLHTFVARGLGEGLNGADALRAAFRETDESFLARVRGTKSSSSSSSSSTNEENKIVKTNRNDIGSLSGTLSINSSLLFDDDDDDDDDDVLNDEDDDDLNTLKSRDPLRGSIAGTCASTVLVDNDRMYIANAGDSRAVLCRGGKAIALSRDHKPNCPDEIARIVEAGGFVTLGRTNGQLAVSRALGDCMFKGFDDENASPRHERELPTVTSEPEITEIPISCEDEFLVIACDGLFDVMSNEDVVRFVRASRSETTGMPFDLSRVASDLVDHAIEDLNSKDNVSCIVIALESPDLIETRKSKHGSSSGGSGGVDNNKSPSTMSLRLDLTNEMTSSQKGSSSIDDLLEYASSPSHAKHFQNRKIPTHNNDDDRFGAVSSSMMSHMNKDEKKKSKSGRDAFRRRLGDLDDNGLLDYLLDDSNFSPEQQRKSKRSPLKKKM